MQAMCETKIYYDKNGIVVRDSAIDDAIAIAWRLRTSDAQEVYASHHHTPKDALVLSYTASDPCFTVEIKGVPAAMFGAVPEGLLSDRATIWMLSTDDIFKVRKSLVKECRNFIKIMLERYYLLENYVDARNTLSIKWLEWCGAVIEDAKPYGKENLPFHYFSFRRTF